MFPRDSNGSEKALHEQLVLIGGVTQDSILLSQDEMMLFSVVQQDGGSCQITHVSRLVDDGMLSGRGPTRPLLAGISVEMTEDGQLVVMGGGATCYSMGTYWNTTAYSFRLDRQDLAATKEAASTQTPEESANYPGQPWGLWKIQEMPPAVNPKKYSPVPGGAHDLPAAQPATDPKLARPVPRLTLNSATDFPKILRGRQPVIFSGLDIGTCMSTWNLDSLAAKVGGERSVVIHDSSTRSMDFVRTNFPYVPPSFRDFIERVRRGDRLYLRALSRDEPSEKPADLAEDFPSLALDFVLPPELGFVHENLFSSVLRVSGPVNMWLHYDVMANIYCQIHGSKRMLLFPPSDVQHLSFRPGSSSSNIDVFDASDSTHAALHKTDRREAVLEPGDLLFLPPLWLHAGSPESDASIAVNVFFRDLSDRSGYAPGRDVYGNRDLAPYEKGRQDVAKIAKGFEKLPSDAREFYLLRLADELRDLVNG